jgi:hypothetical protein
LLESDFKLVIIAFTNPAMPWKIMIYWLNVLHITKFILSPIKKISFFFITNIFWIIWKCRNFIRFENKFLPCKKWLTS